jgi:hypothetical protein
VLYVDRVRGVVAVDGTAKAEGVIAQSGLYRSRTATYMLRLTAMIRRPTQELIVAEDATLSLCVIS